ncbi:MAG TPA: VWA domain-containing protein, partial [Alphaproteobacteria bacterium]|nr:VWA domain-containing protein [Alphaproteobacteria bacterium]
MTPEDDLPGAAGKLPETIMHFGRVLRAAGLPAGPGRVIDAVRAAETAGIERREDLYWALHAVFVNRRDQRDLFDQAFYIFWRNPKILERMLSVLLPSFGADAANPPSFTEANRRLAEALFPGADAQADERAEDDIRFDAAFTYSGREALNKMDFESMSAAELAEVRAAIRRLVLPI